MAIRITPESVSPSLTAAKSWMEACLIGDGSMFQPSLRLWTRENLFSVQKAFVEHPLYGADRFINKLEAQMQPCASEIQKLMAEVLWILLLFPSNLKSSTKRDQIRRIWQLSGEAMPDLKLFDDKSFAGIGSGGPGYLAYRPAELAYLLTIALHAKELSTAEREETFTNYSSFIAWIDKVPRYGDRQFRHMLRYFAFPEQVERISSNNDRHRILEAFRASASSEIYGWSDQQLDVALLKLRQELVTKYPGKCLDFYEPPLRETWLPERQVNTTAGAIIVTVPGAEEADSVEAISRAPTAHADEIEPVRHSLHVQARLAAIGSTFGFRVWIPANDRQAVRTLLPESQRSCLLEGALPMSYDANTLDTVKQIDVIWMRGRAIERAFEVEHTTAIYSGLLRMADLLALQPNINIKLHIVADEDRKDEVKRQIQRPVFSLLSAGPLAASCTFLSYDAVEQLAGHSQLRYMRPEFIETLTEAAEGALDNRGKLPLSTD